MGKFLMLMLAALLAGCTSSGPTDKPNADVKVTDAQQPKSEPKTLSERYSLAQAMSDNAQLNTIAFDGLAFMTGSLGADSFFPPGKVADFFSFQYMRDIDVGEKGHNSQFLTRICMNVLTILDSAQKEQLFALAKEQEKIYTDFAFNRFPLLKAFRRNLEGDLPAGSTGLDKEAVIKYTSQLYELDAALSYRRAQVVGGVINSFTEAQRASMSKLVFGDFATWQDIPEYETIKKGLSHMAHVAVMTYASELFSWYAGSVEADTYFCPERHATYFGGFFMKDYPAMGNPDYYISTAITGDKGAILLKDILTEPQAKLITEIISLQKPALQEIAEIRRQVAVELRKFMTGQATDRQHITSLVKRYGELDGEISYYCATRFAQVYKTLTADQLEKIKKLRDLDVIPQGMYLFAEAIPMPDIANTDFLFTKK